MHIPIGEKEHLNGTKQNASRSKLTAREIERKRVIARATCIAVTKLVVFRISCFSTLKPDKERIYVHKSKSHTKCVCSMC